MVGRCQLAMGHGALGCGGGTLSPLLRPVPHATLHMASDGLHGCSASCISKAITTLSLPDHQISMPPPLAPFKAECR